MSSTMFSPEPWTVKGDGSEGWRDIVDSRDGIVALVDVRLDADARLIAAAPEMCELLIAFFKEGGMECAFPESDSLIGRASRLLARIHGADTEDPEDPEDADAPR